MQRARSINVCRGPQGFGFSIIDVDLPNSRGIFVSQVTENSPAAAVGDMREGMQVRVEFIRYPRDFECSFDCVVLIPPRWRFVSVL